MPIFERNLCSMSNETNRACPVCGGVDFRNHLKVTDHSISREVFYIDTCKKCGFLFTANPPAEKDCGTYYKSNTYISHSDTRKGMVSHMYHLVRRFMLGRKASLLERLGADKSLLDVGSGTGYFASKMQELGYRSSAVEPDEGARNYSRDKFGLQVEAPEWLFTQHNLLFGYITLWHVLEHIYEPDKYFQRFTELLLPGGYLIVALPNHKSYDARHYREYWAAYDVPRHLWHFNPTTLTSFAQKNGFSVSDKIQMPFDSFYNCILSERYAGSKGGLLKGAIMGLIAFLEGAVNTNKASSVIYVLRKDNNI